MIYTQIMEVFVQYYFSSYIISSELFNLFLIEQTSQQKYKKSIQCRNYLKSTYLGKEGRG